VFRITAHNRGPESAPIHLIPQLWFRNTWSWSNEPTASPVIRAVDHGDGRRSLLADDSHAAPLAGLLATTTLGPHKLDLPAGARLLFTDNETNGERVFGPGNTSKSRYVKDAFHRLIVNGESDAVNPAETGTKACGWMRFDVEPGASAVMHMTFRPPAPADDAAAQDLAAEVDSVIAVRRAEADHFYDSIHPVKASAIERNVQRQAFAGMLWTKQSYLFDVDMWLDGDDPRSPPPAERQRRRNAHWRHLNSMRVLSMPDAWEYPWFAAWDLAFHAVVLALIDPAYAKEQLWLMLFEQFQHPNGQIPAYEWEFSDLNPPVHAWAVWRVYNMDRIRSGKGDRDFLEKCFHKLMLNFTWWVNKVDREGNNVFEGGFLGLDNITVFDRSEPLPDDAALEQSDATGWMGMFCLVMMRISLELAHTNPAYENLATKFFEHYVYIGAAMKMVRGDRTIWDEADGFFYDLLRFPDGTSVPFRIRSLVGLIPLYAIERLEEKWIEPFPTFRENLEACVTRVVREGEATHVLAVVDQHQLQRLLAHLGNAAEFLSPHGMRSLSKHHQAHPFVFGNASVAYDPAEATAKLKGGNSNWRGPVWFPTSFLMIESLRKLEKAFGGSVRVAFDDGPDDAATPPLTTTPDPGGSPWHETRGAEGLGAVSSPTADRRVRGMTLSGNVPIPTTDEETISLSGLAGKLANRMIGIFIPDKNGYRPLFGAPGTRQAELFAKDPHWKDLLLFYEYFHGETGEGLGASHQTGWTGLVASLIDEWRM
ncbi:MAG: glucosidase, partial [Acidobacteriota bacterium]